jgi:hypothetical protein
VLWKRARVVIYGDGKFPQAAVTVRNPKIMSHGRNNLHFKRFQLEIKQFAPSRASSR